MAELDSLFVGRHRIGARGIGNRRLGPADLLANPDLKPILIPAETCGNYAPLLVSPQHGMLLSGAQSGGPEALVRAKHMAEAPGPVRVAKGKKHVTYIHLMFDQHQIIFANGAPSESFYPGDCALAMFTLDILQDLRRLIPGLGEKSVKAAYGPTARPFFKRRKVLSDVDLRPDPNKALAA